MSASTRPPRASRAGPPTKEPPLPPPLPEGQAIPLGVQPFRWFHHARATLVLLVLIVLVGSILYPLAVTGIAVLVTPDTARGLPFADQNQSRSGQNNTTANGTPAIDAGAGLPAVGTTVGVADVGMRPTGGHAVPAPHSGAGGHGGAELIPPDASSEG